MHISKAKQRPYRNSSVWFSLESSSCFVSLVTKSQNVILVDGHITLKIDSVFSSGKSNWLSKRWDDYFLISLLSCNLISYWYGLTSNKQWFEATICFNSWRGLYALRFCARFFVWRWQIPHFIALSTIPMCPSYCCTFWCTTCRKSEEKCTYFARWLVLLWCIKTFYRYRSCAFHWKCGCDVILDVFCAKF